MADKVLYDQEEGNSEALVEELAKAELIEVHQKDQ
jgi:hypothetical protein